MGRGESCGGGQSSLGYLFASSDKETEPNTQPPPENPTQDPAPDSEPSPKPYETEETSQKNPSESFSIINQNPSASVHDSTTNNYHRADGQNCGNFITNRPSTKVHAAPGGNTSIGFLFGDKEK